MEMENGGTSPCFLANAALQAMMEIPRSFVVG